MFAGPPRAHVTNWWKADFYTLVRCRRFRLNPDCLLCLDLKHRQGGWEGRGKKKGKKTRSTVSVLTWAADLIRGLAGANVSPVVADYQQTSLKWLHKSTSLKRIRIANLDMNVVTWTFLVSECFTPPLYAHESFLGCRKDVNSQRLLPPLRRFSSKLLKISLWINYWTVWLCACVHSTSPSSPAELRAGDTHSSTRRPRCNLTWGSVHAATLNSSPLPFSRVSGSTFLQANVTRTRSTRRWMPSFRDDRWRGTNLFTMNKHRKWLSRLISPLILCQYGYVP